MKENLKIRLVIFSAPWIFAFFWLLIEFAHLVSGKLICWARGGYEMALGRLELLAPGLSDQILSATVALLLLWYIYLFFSSWRAVGLSPTLSKIRLGRRLISKFAYALLHFVETPFKKVFDLLSRKKNSFSDLIKDSEPYE